uniref:Secreted protein n=1 Tax=Fundulus heteroclitus TaxID=8078 RepID=A0A3Q2P5L3_FUNHE
MLKSRKNTLISRRFFLFLVLFLQCRVNILGLHPACTPSPCTGSGHLGMQKRAAKKTKKKGQTF